MKRPALFILMGLLAFTAIRTAWVATYHNQLGGLHAFATYKLAQVLDQFDGQVNKFRLLPTLLARRPVVIEMADSDQLTKERQDYFLSTLHLTGSTEIQLLSVDGTVIASARKYSESAGQHGPVVKQEYFQEALAGSLGYNHFVDAEREGRSIIFARSVLGSDGKAIGVVTVEADIEQFETEWRGIPEGVLFVDSSKRIFLSNRSNYINARLVSQPTSPPTRGADSNELSANGSVSIALAPDIDTPLEGIQIWNNLGTGKDNGPYLALSKNVPVHEMEAVLLVSTAPAKSVANLMAMLAAAIIGMISIAIYAYDLRRRRLVERLDLEQQLNAVLEERISKRTSALEMAQAKLAEAAKMSALGKMSASIGHELNQPIASIQNFAVNSRKFLKKGNKAAVESNLREIDTLTHRMNQIIKNLRAFSRNEKTEVFVVNLRNVVDVATQISRPRLDHEGITLTIDEPVGECLVRGGEVRLQQVLVNLISNAADAVSGKRQKNIRISWNRVGGTTVLQVRDNGHGIQDDNKLFEPFYTTKDVDEGHGLGLGLAISYSIIRSFGGTINGENHPDGGAVFTITLQNAPESRLEAAQ